MSQAEPVHFVSRLKTKKPMPITATAAAAFSEYIARPAMLAEPIAMPSKGTAQQATHAMPVIQAIRLAVQVPGVSSFNTLKSFLSGRACTIKPGVRSMVKPPGSVLMLARSSALALALLSPAIAQAHSLEPTVIAVALACLGIGLIPGLVAGWLGWSAIKAFLCTFSVLVLLCLLPALPGSPSQLAGPGLVKLAAFAALVGVVPLGIAFAVGSWLGTKAKQLFSRTPQ
jgi:hypothetical protein